MTPSDQCLTAVEADEGCELEIYPDLNGFASIGRGHKLTHDDVVSGRYVHGISQHGADVLFLADITPREAQLNQALAVLKWAVTQGQYDALFSFMFNEGISRLMTLAAHGFAAVPTQLPLWVYAGGVVAPGLVKRRAMEVQWWKGE